MNTTTPSRFRACLMAVAILAGAYTTANAADPTLTGTTVANGKQTIDLQAGALPAQITIAASPAELPLNARAKDAATPVVLAEIGRGDQLRQPIRLEAKVAGGSVALEATGAGKVAAGPPVSATTEYAADTLKAAVTTTVDASGAITFAITYGGAGTEVESFDLVMPIVGRVDTAIAGDPSAPATADTIYAVGTDDGVAWQNTGAISPLFVGSGDRGFTFITDTAAGWQVDAKQPIAVIERDTDGHATLRLKLVNSKRKLAAPATATITLLVHPHHDKAADHRLASWKPWGDTPAVGTDRELTAAARTGEADILAARAATVHEAFAKRAALEGSSGGQAAAADKPLTDVFPIRQFQYLAATHTGVTAQLRPSAPAAYHAGANPGLDRMAIGRALLHDIGLDPYGLAHHADAAAALRALHGFGYFTADGNTEYIPYWRSAAYVRYGEVFAPGGNFEVTAEDPMARVHTTVYLRPGDAPNTYRAMFIIVNEGDTPVREQLYILNPKRVFGGGNKLLGRQISATWDTSGLPAHSDWQAAKLANHSNVTQSRDAAQYLKDLEDEGYVRIAANDGGMEVYGALHIPAHSYRIVYGQGFTSK